MSSLESPPEDAGGLSLIWYPARLSPVEEKISSTATSFIATAFVGRGCYDRTTVVDLAATREAANALSFTCAVDVVLVYALDAGGRQAMIGTWRRECE